MTKRACWALCLAATAALASGCGGGDTNFVVPPGPSIAGINPTSGSAAGGTAVVLTGSGFTAFTQVTVDGAPVNGLTLVNATTMTFTTPSGAPGLVDVQAANDLGMATLVNAFTYVPTQLLGADGKAGFPGNLFGIDPVTGAAHTIGPIGFAITGLAMFTDGFLYGTESSRNDMSRLIRIDPVTGAGTVVGPLETAAAVAHPSIADLTVSNGVLFGWSENGDQPVTIDHLTGLVTVVGGGTGSFGSGIAADAVGTIFSTTSGVNGTLDTVDPLTGVVTVGPAVTGASPNPSAINALAFLNGTLFALGNDSDNSPASALELYRIDTATGVMTLVAAYPPGAFGGRAMDSLAGATP
jgi:hypothetical protein